MSKNTHLYGIGAKGALTVALSSMMVLSACQFGGQDAPTSEDIDNAARDQQGQVSSNVDASQGGAVVNAGNESDDAPSENASTKTGFDDLWMLDSVDGSDGTVMFDDQDVLYYGTSYEVVLAMELTEDETDGRVFVCSLPGMDLIGTWEEVDETEATITIPLSDNESATGTITMSSDYQTADLSISQPGNAGPGFTYHFHRDDDTTVTLDQMYEAMAKNNDEFYESLPVDVANDITFVDDEHVQMRLLGTTHTDGNVGYLIEVTNKTTTPYILNDFVADDAAFTVNGQSQIAPLYGRVLPPTYTDEETGETMVAPMRCAILFSEEEVGSNLESVLGNLVVTDYHWNEIGRYQFTVGQ